MKNGRPTMVTAMAAGALMLLSACGSSGGSTETPTSGTSAVTSGTTSVPSTTGTTSTTTTKSLKIGYANITNANPTLKGVADLIQGAGKVSGDTVTLYDNQANPDTAVQVANLMVGAKPDVIMDWAPSPQIGPSLSAIFQRAKIPCIAVNIAIPKCAYWNLDNPGLGTQVGEALAKIMASKGWDGSNTTYLIGQNAKVGDDNNSIVRNGYVAVANAVSGFTKTTLDKITASTTTIGSSAVQVDGGDAVDTSYAAMKNALQSIPVSRNIVEFGITDETTLGAERALANSGRKYILAGNGAGPEGISNLRTNANWAIEAGSFVPQWGEFLMAMAHAQVAGADMPAKTVSPDVVLTKDNVDTYYASDGTTVKTMPSLPDVDQYLVQTGVLQKYKNIQGLS